MQVGFVVYLFVLGRHIPSRPLSMLCLLWSLKRLWRSKRREIKCPIRFVMLQIFIELYLVFCYSSLITHPSDTHLHCAICKDIFAWSTWLFPNGLLLFWSIPCPPYSHYSSSSFLLATVYLSVCLSVFWPRRSKWGASNPILILPSFAPSSSFSIH